MSNKAFIKVSEFIPDLFLVLIWWHWIQMARKKHAENLSEKYTNANTRRMLAEQGKYMSYSY